MSSPTSGLPHSFISKKKRILQRLAVPLETYDDLSPKGSIDEGIRDLIDEINQLEGCVTTSSCAGRISIFSEGNKVSAAGQESRVISRSESEGASGNVQDDLIRETTAGIGGKGGGGKWLFVSHDRLCFGERNSDLTKTFGMVKRSEGRILQAYEAGSRLIHFKFEPMILHILTASLAQAQTVLSAALQAGFRESGALNLVSSGTEPATPMVAVRSMGLALESLVGYHCDGQEICIVSPVDLDLLVEISNERFKENERRISRFRALLNKLTLGSTQKERKKGEDGEAWEDPISRRERKKQEGLLKRQKLKVDQEQEESAMGESSVGFLEQNT